MGSDSYSVNLEWNFKLYMAYAIMEANPYYFIFFHHTQELLHNSILKH